METEMFGMELPLLSDDSDMEQGSNLSKGPRPYKRKMSNEQMKRISNAQRAWRVKEIQRQNNARAKRLEQRRKVIAEWERTGEFKKDVSKRAIRHRITHKVVSSKSIPKGTAIKSTRKRRPQKRVLKKMRLQKAREALRLKNERMREQKRNGMTECNVKSKGNTALTGKDTNS